MSWYYSPFIIPLAGISVAIVAIVANAFSQMQSSRLKAEQRMAMLARGIPIAEIEAVLQGAAFAEAPQPKDPMRSLGNARRTAVALISCGLGLILFFVILTVILRVREVLAGAAAGLIPLAIGIGFAIDYQLQTREMARFGLEVGPDAARRQAGSVE